MDLFANDLSIHGQFRDLSSFRDAFARLMAMREVARRFGREVYCNRALLTVEAMPRVSMPQALDRLPLNEKRSAMRWLTRGGGPFWDDLRQHDAGDWLECQGQVVTDTAVGEAAYRKLHRIECGLISAKPSDWNSSPLEVIWRQGVNESKNLCATLENWRDTATLENSLQQVAQPLQSWGELQSVSMIRFRALTFATDCFEPLTGIPFSKGAAERFLVLLDVLDRLVQAVDADGKRTPEGNWIHENYFIGDNALFSDSSASERQEFQSKLMFPHPDQPGKPLLCTWHGKVRTLTLRLHFSQLVRFGKLTYYVAYAGPKLTKR